MPECIAAKAAKSNGKTASLATATVTYGPLIVNTFRNILKLYSLHRASLGALTGCFCNSILGRWSAFPKGDLEGTPGIELTATVHSSFGR